VLRLLIGGAYCSRPCFAALFSPLNLNGKPSV
jgi:hypothetical protein